MRWVPFFSPLTRGEDESMIETLKRLWRGEMPLATAFWVFVIAYGALIELTFTAVSLILYLNFDARVAAITTHLLPLPYFVIAWTGTWRSADRYDGHPLVAYLAKVAIVLTVGVVLFL